MPAPVTVTYDIEYRCRPYPYGDMAERPWRKTDYVGFTNIRNAERSFEYVTGRDFLGHAYRIAEIHTTRLVVREVPYCRMPGDPE